MYCHFANIVQWISSIIHLHQSYVILQPLHFGAGPMDSEREATELQPVEMEVEETEETNSMPDSDANQEEQICHGRSWEFNILSEMNYNGEMWQEFSIFNALHGFLNTTLLYILLIDFFQSEVFHWQECDKIRRMLWKVLKINLSQHPTLERPWRCWLCLTRKSHYFAQASICSWPI